MIDELADVLLGAVCALCGRSARGLCSQCAHMAWDGVDGVHLVPTAPVGVPVWAGALYEGAVRAAVLAWKRGGNHRVGEWLGWPLAAAVLAVLNDDVEDVVLVAVPSTRLSRRRRGARLVDELTDHAIALLVGLGVDARRADALTLVRQPRDQVGLSRADRASNIEGAMRARRCRGQVVVIDDVVTTGATLSEAVRALMSAGNEVRGAAVVASRQRPSR